jgi:hypothetical protein
MNAPSEHRLADYLEGLLSPEKEAEVQNYLDTHPELKTELDAMSTLYADACELELPLITEQGLAEAHEDLMSSLVEHAAPKAKRAHLHQFTAYQLIASAAAALIFGVLLSKTLLQDAGLSKLHEMRAGFIPAKVQAQQDCAPLSRHFAVQDFSIQGDQSVRIRFDETSQYEISGRPEEADIQNYLGYILRNDSNESHRSKAVILLDEHCAAETTCDVLIYALTQDPSVEVRREAAMALSEDRDRPMVKQAYLKMMSQDPAKELRDFALSVLAQEAPVYEIGNQGGTR